MSNRLPFLFIQNIKGKGRSVYTGQAIPQGSLIELCPALILSSEDCLKIHSTKLHDYYFLWGTEGECAIALGYGSIYNHASTSNAEYEMVFGERCIRIIAKRDIDASEEITINYLTDGEQKSILWFEEN